MKNTFFFGALCLLIFCISCKPSQKLAENSKLALAGTEWELNYESENDGKVTYRVEFAAEGKLISHNPNNNTPDNDTWEQNGNEVILKMNDAYAVYKGNLVSKWQMVGMASNSLESDWPWSAKRINP